MAQAAELQQWQHQYCSVVVWRGVKNQFMVVGQARVCLFNAIATVFQLYHDGVLMYEMRRRKPESTLLLTQELFNPRHHIGTDKCYSSDQDSDPCPQGHQPSAITN